MLLLIIMMMMIMYNVDVDKNSCLFDHVYTNIVIFFLANRVYIKSFCILKSIDKQCLCSCIKKRYLKMQKHLLRKLKTLTPEHKPFYCKSFWKSS